MVVRVSAGVEYKTSKQFSVQLSYSADKPPAAHVFVASYLLLQEAPIWCWCAVKNLLNQIGFYNCI